MVGRRWGRVAAFGAAGGVVATIGLGACGDEAAKVCSEQSGATFCVRRQGQAAVEVSATGLAPGSDWSAVLEGDGVPDSSGAQPRVMQVGPEGTAGGLTIGVVGLASKGVPDGTRVVFIATDSTGSPVTVTVVVGG
jgi:hypothetical protein